MKSVWTPFVPMRSDAKTCSNCYRTFYGLQGSAGPWPESDPCPLLESLTFCRLTFSAYRGPLERLYFPSGSGGRSRTRTYDPLIKSQLSN
jgi:hypothetical protein